MSGTRVCEHVGHMAEIAMKLTTLGVFLRMVRHGVVNMLPTEDMIRNGDSDGVLIRVSQDMIRQWFGSDIFCVLRRMCCNLILSLTAIARIAEADWDGTRMERIPFEHERAKFMIILRKSGMMSRRADGTKLTEGGHNEIRLVYREEFADRGMSRDFAERAWHRFFETADNYKKYPVSDEQNRVTGYRICPGTSERAQGNLTLDADQSSLLYQRPRMMMTTGILTAP